MQPDLDDNPYTHMMIGMPTALVVSPHAPTRDALTAALNGSGVAAVAASECDDALRCLTSVRVDIVLLDTLCGDVQTLRRYVRALSGPIPVLYVAGRDAAYSPVALTPSAEADAVICRPVDPSEVVSAAKVALGLGVHSGDGRVTIGRLTLDADNNLVHVDEVEIRLTQTEFRIFRCLAEGEGDVVSNAVLFRRVWGIDPMSGSGDMVRAHIRNIRRKLASATGRDDWLLTAPRRGYRLVAG